MVSFNETTYTSFIKEEVDGLVKKLNNRNYNKIYAPGYLIYLITFFVDIVSLSIAKLAYSEKKTILQFCGMNVIIVLDVIIQEKNTKLFRTSS